MSARKHFKKMQESIERDLVFAEHMARLYETMVAQEPSNIKASENLSYYKAQTDILQTIVKRFKDL
jgi:hypothetical protein